MIWLQAASAASAVTASIMISHFGIATAAALALGRLDVACRRVGNAQMHADDAGNVDHRRQDVMAQRRLQLGFAPGQRAELQRQHEAAVAAGLR